MNSKFRSLVLFLAVANASASYAQSGSLKVNNLSYPERSMTIECIDDCTLMSVESFTNEQLVSQFRISKSTVEQTVKDRRSFLRNTSGPYFLTKTQVKAAKRDFKEAYYVKSVANTILVPLTSILDTAYLPVNLIESIRPKRDSIKSKKAARRLLVNLESDSSEMTIRHKYYSELQKYLESIAMNYSHLSLDEVNRLTRLHTTEQDPIVQSYLNNEFKNCKIALMVSDWADQVFINGVFSGNTDWTDISTKFVPLLKSLEENGTCIRR